MPKIDHLIVEVDNPQTAANNVAKQLGLPLAWPLMRQKDYTSSAVNFGFFNIEFICFNVRFGKLDTRFKGFSGIGFNIQKPISMIIEGLESNNTAYRITNKLSLYTSIIIEEENIFPTVFYVTYRYATDNWRKRLLKEFYEATAEGYKIIKLHSFELTQEIPRLITAGFPFKKGKKNRIFFDTNLDKTIVFDNIIENLEIVFKSKETPLEPTDITSHVNIIDIERLENGYVLAKKALNDITYAGGYYPIYPDEIKNFFSLAFNKPWSYGPYLPKEEANILNNIKTASFNDLCTLLKCASRSKHFGDGCWIAILEKDTLQLVMKRMRELIISHNSIADSN